MTYVLSDIHGNLHNFDSILSQIDLQVSDTLYVLGDVIDRHPYGVALLQRIMKMSNVHVLLGNHEYMMMDTLGFPYDGNSKTHGISMEQMRIIWYHNGGRVTHKAWDKLPQPDKADLVDYLKALPLNADLHINGQWFKLVHGTAEEVYDTCQDTLNESKMHFCVWDRDSIFKLAEEDFITVFGHTPTASFQRERPLEVFRYKNIIGIDCGSGWPLRDGMGRPYGGRLACICLDDGQVFYSKSEIDYS